MYFVYIIRSTKDKTLYTGWTTNIKTRLRDHNNGKVFHTSKHSPFKIIWIGIFVDKYKAIAFENYLKSGSGIAFRNRHLIN